jgi:alpha-ketoglutarate-dependent taurine dioxygenase
MGKIAGIKAATVRMEGSQLVRIGQLSPGQDLPLLVEAAAKSADLREWRSANAALIDEALRTRGGVLFRGFTVAGPDEFARFVQDISPELLEYKERSTPRTEVGGRIYTSTEYPADQEIALHNEFSYSYTWPMRIAFYCESAPSEGGETPIADSRRVLALLDHAVRDRFVDRQVMYVRNYGTGIDLSWQEAFQTVSRSAVEEYCRRSGIECEWGSGDQLRTRQVRPSTAIHPVTGEMVWFNQAHLFHPSNLGAAAASTMRSLFAAGELPRNACFGDGTAFSDADLATVRGAIRAASVSYPWQKGDILLLDNMLVAHGRRPFRGPRRILTAMAQPYASKANAALS